MKTEQPPHQHTSFLPCGAESPHSIISILSYCRLWVFCRILLQFSGPSAIIYLPFVWKSLEIFAFFGSNNFISKCELNYFEHVDSPSVSPYGYVFFKWHTVIRQKTLWCKLCGFFFGKFLMCECEGESEEKKKKIKERSRQIFFPERNDLLSALLQILVSVHTVYYIRLGQQRSNDMFQNQVAQDQLMSKPSRSECGRGTDADPAEGSLNIIKHDEFTAFLCSLKFPQFYVSVTSNIWQVKIITSNNYINNFIKSLKKQIFDKFSSDVFAFG